VNGLLRRFSSTYRNAVAHEAVGEYTEAAKEYALCGDPVKAAEMHLLAASRCTLAKQAIAALRVAEHLLGDEKEVPASLWRRLGEAYLRVVPVEQPALAEQEVFLLAAAAFWKAEEFSQAARAFRAAGRMEQAAECLERAGDIEEVEALYEGEAQKRQHKQTTESLFAQADLADQQGKRDDAARLFRELLGLIPGHAEALGRLHAIEARVLHKGIVAFGVTRGPEEEEQRMVFATPPFFLGRGEGRAPDFGDLGVSREHAQIEWGAAVGFSVTDTGSKNGVFLDGVRLSTGATLPLRSEAVLGLGRAVRLEVQKNDQELLLRVHSGVRKGWHLRSGVGEFRLDEGLSLRFEHGRPWISAMETEKKTAQEQTGGLMLNGRRVGSPVQVSREDEIRTSRLLLKVLGP